MTAPQSVEQRAAKLPAPAPGEVVTVPLDALPAYLSLHRIEPCGNDRGTLIVRRME